MARKTFHKIKKRLVAKHDRAKIRIERKHPESSRLLTEKGLKANKLRDHAVRLLTGATMASALLTQPAMVPMLSEKAIVKGSGDDDVSRQVNVGAKYLPLDRGQLNPWEVGGIAKILEDNHGVRVDAELSGQRLNHQYGWIGFEQHLKRFPGDSLYQHDEMKIAGMAPGLGAWGYFANSKSQMKEIDVQREKYYVAVQTLYLPEWNSASPDELIKLKEWYKYRKVVVMNPENGKVVVAVIGDAGPAEWTGKQFGGSPEVMRELDLHKGMRKGKVVVLFVDDVDDKVALGPLSSTIDM